MHLRESFGVLSLFFHLQVPPETESVEGIIFEEKEHIIRHPGVTIVICFFLGHYTSITEGFQIQAQLQVFKATAEFSVSLVKPLPFASGYAFGHCKMLLKTLALKLYN